MHQSHYVYTAGSSSYCVFQGLLVFAKVQTFFGLGRCVEAGMWWITLELASVPMYTGCLWTGSSGVPKELWP